MAKATAATLRPLDRRRAASLAFLAAINSIDMVAPGHGRRRLTEYFAEHAQNLRGPSPGR
jgi:hypothetical protein